MATHAATEPGAAAFFDELRETWTRASAAAPSETRRFRVAGLALEIRFAGDALLEPLTRALAHLPEPASDAAAALVVYAWDTRTTGVSAPRPAWGADDYREYGKIRGLFDERFQCVFQWGSHSLVMLDVERNEAIYWVGAAEDIQYFERAAPLRLVLHGWLQSRGVELIHAAAVGSADGCVLIVGKSGSGKSWSTMASTASGLGMISDDYCLLSAGPPPHISSLYSSAKTHGDALERLPFLTDMVSNPIRPDYDKAVYFLGESAPERLLLEADLRAIVIPRLAGQGRARLSPAPGAAGLAALAPSTILQLPAAGARTLARLAALARTVPSFHLDVGTELDAIGPTIAALLTPGSG